MSLVLVLLIPLVISGVAFFALRATITWKEFLLQVGVSVATVAIGWQVAKWGSIQATEHLNGRILEKVEDTQSCCHCHQECASTDSKGNCTSYREVCSHSYDYYWDLKTTVGTIGIEDCSGSSTPPRVWVNAKVGEPASTTHLYSNYLLADPDSLFVHDTMGKFEKQIPEYPEIRDHYKLDHVVGPVIPDGWQDAVREINADIGHSNQVDLTLVTTYSKEPTFAQALEAKWLYGPKNSLNIVMGIDGDTIRWVRVVTFSRVEMLKVRLRDQLQGLKVSDPKVLEVVRSEVSTGFRRTAMAEFEYLASTAQPTGWSLALLFLFEIVVSLGLTYLMHKHDVFNENPFRGYHGYDSYPKPRWRR